MPAQLRWVLLEQTRVYVHCWKGTADGKPFHTVQAKSQKAI